MRTPLKTAPIGGVVALAAALFLVPQVYSADLAGGNTVQPPPAYPLKKSANGRYLVDSKGAPFLLAGDAPQALMVKLTEAEADLYFSNRVAHGFNSLWINLLCRPGTGGRKDGATYDGILPFTVTDDLSAPKEAYFARCDQMMSVAQKHGLLVVLDPAETIDHLKLLVANGPEKCRAFGRYLGRRYKRFPNLIWMSGNDFQTWHQPKDDEAALAVAKGIREADPDHLQTVELNYEVSGSLDDPNWESVISLSCAYTYYPTYAQVLKEYNRPNFLPVIMIESDYEFEQRATPLCYAARSIGQSWPAPPARCMAAGRSGPSPIIGNCRWIQPGRSRWRGLRPCSSHTLGSTWPRINSTSWWSPDTGLSTARRTKVIIT